MLNLPKYSSKCRIIAILSLLTIVVFNACNSRPHNVLSKSKMIRLITEIHTLEGVIEASGSSSNKEDNELYFNTIFAKYNTSRADFDSSLVWYTSKPRDFERIYKAVLENLQQLQTDVQDRKYHPIDYEALRNSQSDLWERAENITVTPDSPLVNTRFVVKNTILRWKDVYQLRFIERVSPSDSSRNLYAVMRIHYHTGLTDSVRIDLHSDSVKRRYSVTMPAKDTLRIDSMTANLFVYDYIDKNCKVQIDSIKLVRNYDALIQDSLLNIVNRIDTTRINTLKIQK